jgi:hypothetical protein
MICTTTHYKCLNLGAEFEDDPTNCTNQPIWISQMDCDNTNTQATISSVVSLDDSTRFSIGNSFYPIWIGLVLIVVALYIPLGWYPFKK